MSRCHHAEHTGITIEMEAYSASANAPDFQAGPPRVVMSEDVGKLDRDACGVSDCITPRWMCEPRLPTGVDVTGILP